MNTISERTDCGLRWEKLSRNRESCSTKQKQIQMNNQFESISQFDYVHTNCSLTHSPTGNYTTQFQRCQTMTRHNSPSAIMRCTNTLFVGVVDNDGRLQKRIGRFFDSPFLLRSMQFLCDRTMKCTSSTITTAQRSIIGLGNSITMSSNMWKSTNTIQFDFLAFIWTIGPWICCTRKPN